MILSDLEKRGQRAQCFEWISQRMLAGNYLHSPIGGGTPPIDINTPPNCAPPLGVCILFWWCIRTQRRSLGISLLGDPEIFSVLVCLASVCIIIRIQRRCFIV